MVSSESVSVVIATYNSAQYLEECIRSVLNQSRAPSQIIICDDASTDSTTTIIREVQARHPRLVESVLHEKNRGIAFNFNSGFERATQKYVSLIAGDDLWMPRKLEEEFRTLEIDPTAHWAYSDSFIIDEASNYIEPFKRKYDGCEGDVLFQVLTHQMSLRNWLAETSLVQDLGYFDTRLQIFEDWDFKIRLAEASRIRHIPQEHVAYRRHGSGISRSSGRVFFESLRYVHRKHQQLVNKMPVDCRREILSQALAELRASLDRWYKASDTDITVYYCWQRMQLSLMKIRATM
jgi:glycosyltransferase involved in cell wall biosynthesis